MATGMIFWGFFRAVGGEESSRQAPRWPRAAPAASAISAPSPAGVAAPGHESEAVTTAKCLADLDSPDVNKRRRAVMILGKYRSARAMEGVLRSLEDPDAEVRRSALVSMSEWPFLPMAARGRILHRVVDKDVHVRRLASSMLPDAIMGMRSMAGGVLALGGGGTSGVMVFPNRGNQLPEAELRQVLNQALDDSDVTVKRNVLRLAPSLRGILTREKLEACFSHPDAQVRLLAVRATAGLRGHEIERAKALNTLIKDPDPLVRREVARALGRLGGAGFGGLEKLLNDTDSQVRLDAVRELVEKRHPRGVELIKETVLDESLPAEERQGLVPYAGMYAKDAEGLLLELLDSPSAVIRAAALRTLSRLPSPDRGLEFYARYLDDDSIEVRQSAGRILPRLVARSGKIPGAKKETFTPERLQGLLDSPHADVRVLALRLASLLEPEAREDLLVDACLDSDTTVRCEAIRRLAMSGSPTGEDMAIRSLNDPDADIVKAAVEGLAMHPSPRGIKALQALDQRCRDPEVKRLLTLILPGLTRRRNPTRVLPAGRTTPAGTAPIRPRNIRPGPLAPPVPAGP